MSKFCPECGNTLEEGDVFCTKCGVKVGADTKESRKIQTSFLENPDMLVKIGYGGAAMAVLSVFMSAMKSLAGIGVVSIMNLSPIIAIIIILIALFAVYGLKNNKYALALASGQAYLIVIALFAIYCKSAESPGVLGTMNSMAKSSPILFGLNANLFRFGLGLYLLVLSGILLIVVAYLILKLENVEKESNLNVCSELITLEKKSISIQNITLPTWAYTGIYVFMVTLVTMIVG